MDVKLISAIMTWLRGGPQLKTLLANGLQLGKQVHIGPLVSIDYSHCFLITIGDRAVLGPRVIILAHDASTKRHMGYTKIGRVIIGKDAFVGAGAIVLPGVTIGDNAIIGAGSVVTKDVPAGMVAAGNPAQVVCATDDYISHHRTRMATAPVFPAAGWSLDVWINEENKEKMRDRLGQSVGYIE